MGYDMETSDVYDTRKDIEKLISMPSPGNEAIEP
jgi:hypothetical protein